MWYANNQIITLHVALARDCSYMGHCLLMRVVMHISQNKDGSHSVPVSYRETEQAAENACFLLTHS